MLPFHLPSLLPSANKSKFITHFTYQFNVSIYFFQYNQKIMSSLRKCFKDCQHLVCYRQGEKIENVSSRYRNMEVKRQEKTFSHQKFAKYVWNKKFAEYRNSQRAITYHSRGWYSCRTRDICQVLLQNVRYIFHV